MLPDSFFDSLKATYLQADGDTREFDSEMPIMRQALEAVEADLEQYQIERPLGRGGSGIVIKVIDKRLNLPRALKLPRPKGDQILESVKQEMSHLVKVRHQNIIALHTMNEVLVGDLSYPYFVMDFVEGAKDLRKRLSELIISASSRSSLAAITNWLATRLLDAARALSFLHSNRIIHFDVKPPNILVDGDDRPILSDLGFAKYQSDSTEAVVVGFTLFYAHPDLARHYLSGSSQNRIRKRMSPRDFSPAWDIFALGKSLLELLALIDRDFPESISYDPTFLFLHLAACRMLDGHNLSDDDVKTLMKQQSQDDYLSYRESWMKLGRAEFRESGMRYVSMEAVTEDLLKLSEGSTALSRIPELDPFYPHGIQCSSGNPAPFTYRVKKVVEHPVFSRLASVPHLGLIRSIYPTATHSRLEHSIGVYRNCALYLQALYNDSFNPFFRQVVSTSELKCILLCSLLHDLGHFPLAHELEEISPDLKHEDITIRLLENKSVDNDGHTLQGIIEDKSWGWGLALDEVKTILAELITPPARRLFPSAGLKTRMLASIIDGPLDADKLDYLVRDSEECRLPYGKLIDQERFIKNLTMVFGGDDQHRVELGVYERGQSAAESLLFARYLMYQAVYWHHSARSIRVMLSAALRQAAARRDRNNTFYKDFEKLLGLNSLIEVMDIDSVLELINRWTDDAGKELVSLIRRRRFYKRILTVHADAAFEEGRPSRVDRFRTSSSNVNFAGRLQEIIRDSFVTKLSAARGQSRFSQLGETEVDQAVEKLGLPYVILVDAPNPSYGGGRSLRVLPEPQRMQRNYLTRVQTGERISEVWSRVHYRLMRVAAKGRIFCHPDIRETIMAAIGPEGLSEMLDQVIDEFSA